jgi:hypothetical protein
MQPQEELIGQRKENAKLQMENARLRSHVRHELIVFSLLFAFATTVNLFALARFDDTAQYAQQTLEYETKIVHAYGMIIDDYANLVAAHNRLALRVSENEALLERIRTEAAKYGFYIFPPDGIQPEDTHEAPPLPELPDDDDEENPDD